MLVGKTARGMQRDPLGAGPYEDESTWGERASTYDGESLEPERARLLYVITS